MGLVGSLRALLWGDSSGAPGSGPIEEARILDVPSGDNFRDLGGYPTPEGPTAYRRFIRSGSTARLTEADLTRLEIYGVRGVLDLRSRYEDPRITDRFVKRPQVSWLNVPLFDYDLSDPNLMGVEIPNGNYLIDGYVTMLSNHVAIKRIFEFFAETPKDGGVLFHCAAGMDRTGMVSMLLLGLAGVPRLHLVADYLYSFAPIEEVDRVVFDHEQPKLLPGQWNPIPSRKEAIEFMIDRVEGGYGSAREYLRACDLSDDCLEAIWGMLVPSDSTDCRRMEEGC